MKAFRIVGRSIRDAFKSVFRNFSLSMASILCATITLLVVAISLVIAGNVNNATDILKDELTIVVYLEDTVTEDDVTYLQTSIKDIDGVTDVTYKSKAEWQEEMSEYLGNIFSEDENPLADSFTIMVDDVSKIEEIATTIKGMDQVDKASYGEGMINNLVSIFDFVEKITLGIVIALIFVTAFLITNTIKLTIYSRRNEIEIMRLVGSSNTAIKLPFVFEGLIIGVLGSLIPVIVSIYGYMIIYDILEGQLIVDFITLINPYNFIFNIALIIAALGSIIGMFGSLIAVRKYLKI